MILVDSNTWIFYLDRTVPEHARVAPRLESLLETEELLTTTVLQLEVAHYVVRQMGLAARPALKVFFALPAKVDGLEPDDAKEAVRLLQEHASDGIGGRDGAVLHAALKHDVSLLGTSDRALARVARKLGIRTRDLAAR